MVDLCRFGHRDLCALFGLLFKGVRRDGVGLYLGYFFAALSFLQKICLGELKRHYLFRCCTHPFGNVVNCCRVRAAKEQNVVCVVEYSAALVGTVGCRELAQALEVSMDRHRPWSRP